MQCVLCNRVSDDLLLTGDGHVCLEHVHDPNTLDTLPPIVIRKYDAGGKDPPAVKLATQQPYAPYEPPNYCVQMPLTLEQAQLVRHALIMTSCSENGRNLEYSRMIATLNNLIAQEVGIVRL